MRDELGVLFEDSDFTRLFPRRGQPAFAPWRLALINVHAVSGELVRSAGGRTRSFARGLIGSMRSV
jgi:transposase